MPARHMIMDFSWLTLGARRRAAIDLDITGRSGVRELGRSLMVMPSGTSATGCGSRLQRPCDVRWRIPAHSNYQGSTTMKRTPFVVEGEFP